MNIGITSNHLPGTRGRSLMGDLVGGAVPVLGTFAHVETMESLVRYPKGEPIYLRKGWVSVELCQVGVGANLLGSAALAGAGILAATGLAAAALPVLAAGVGALSFSSLLHGLAGQQMESISGQSDTRGVPESLRTLAEQAEAGNLKAMRQFFAAAGTVDGAVAESYAGLLAQLAADDPQRFVVGLDGVSRNSWRKLFELVRYSSPETFAELANSVDGAIAESYHSLTRK